MMMLKGRKKLVSERSSSELEDLNILADVLNNAYIQHLVNKTEIDYLVEYVKGQQNILQKTKEVRPEINNKLVLNHAQMVTRMINGYFLGTPIQYIQADSNAKEEIDKLNRFVAYEDKASVDREIGEYQSVCGTAYRVIYTDNLFSDEIPFEDKALNPATTFVVYENSISERPLLGVTYYNIYDIYGNVTGIKVYAYTNFGMYFIETLGNSKLLDENSIVTLSRFNVGGVPIIEYPNNMWRIGDWELCIDLMEAINKTGSGRLDDIDQVVQSLLVFINADLDSDRYAEMRSAGVVLLKNTTANQSSVESIKNNLDQAGMSLFSAELEKLLYALIGIPDRESRGGSGDTGIAVELRDGWADLETVARNKELVFKKSEKQTLRIILKILENKLSFKLSLLDVDIKFSRNKNNNLLVKTQSYETLLRTKTLSPEDCLTIVDLVSDVNEYITRGKSFWGSSFAGLEEANTNTEMSKVNLETAKNPKESVQGGSVNEN